MEIWKDVLGYKGFYKVSDQGNVINCHGRSVAISCNADGFRSVILSAFGTFRRIGVHYLVWGAFSEFLNTNEKVVHINGDKSDNRLENLKSSKGRGVRKPTTEKWMPYGDAAMVSTFGRLKFTESIITPRHNNSGCQYYLIEGKVKYIHDIMGEVFLGWSKGKGHVTYRDKNPSNTELSNLIVKPYRIRYKKIM